MRVSPEGRRFIESWEGYSGEAYLCPAGVWTIGYGHTEGVRPGQRIGKEAASALLSADLVAFGGAVERLLGGAATDQQEFDALASLAFNVGVDGVRGSTALRLHRKGDKAGAARAFALWNRALIGGELQVVPGLVRRRAAEASLYLTPDEAVVRGGPAADTLPEQVAPDEIPQAVAPPPSALSSKSVMAGGAAVVAGAGSVADQLSQVTPVLDSIATAGASLQSVLKLGAVGLSIVALCAGAWFLWRYIGKLRDGQAVST